MTKGLVLVVAIWVLATSISWDVGQCADITWVVGEGSSESGYTQFLTSLRNMVKGSEVYHEIPMIYSAPATKPPKYLLVEIKDGGSGKTITLSVNKSSLYVTGYSDIYGSKCRYQLFSDFRKICDPTPKEGKPAVLRCRLCEGKTPNDVTAVNLSFASSYDQLGGAAKGSRESVGLGANKLQQYMEKVYGIETIQRVDEARFLLIAVQMVSEAARFTYIENQILSDYPNGFNPDERVICLETEWSKISRAVQNTPPAQPINILVNCGSGKTFTIQGTPQLKEHIALLKYEAKKKMSLLDLDGINQTTDDQFRSVPSDGGSYGTW